MTTTPNAQPHPSPNEQPPASPNEWPRESADERPRASADERPREHPALARLHRYSPPEDYRVAYEAGITAAALAAHTGWSLPTIYARLRAAGTVMGPGARPHALLNTLEVIRLYRDEGWSMNRLAAHMGVSLDTISRRLHRAGVVRTPHTPSPTRLHPDDETFVLYRHGAHPRAIATALGLNPRTVQSRLTKARARGWIT
ncbi:sigma factor-like helix-turn-helix DNA-binding protein [Salinactinospora qingdaonensis]|uniref:RNA polymerase sigma-70 region 4 domain-containing protein n=1 Tax=Salinactinospora qingdaonensis TaxID=702744 RepID=A0ABP7GII8_9ACTN